MCIRDRPTCVSLLHHGVFIFPLPPHHQQGLNQKWLSQSLRSPLLNMWTPFAICLFMKVWPIVQHRLIKSNKRSFSKASAYFMRTKLKPSVPGDFLFLRHLRGAKNSSIVSTHSLILYLHIHRCLQILFQAAQYRRYSFSVMFRLPLSVWFKCRNKPCPVNPAHSALYHLHILHICFSQILLSNFLISLLAMAHCSSNLAWSVF